MCPLGKRSSRTSSRFPWNSNPLYMAAKIRPQVSARSRTRSSGTGHTDSVLGVLGRFKHDSSSARMTSIGEDLDVGPDDVSCRPEQILEILPSNRKRQALDVQVSALTRDGSSESCSSVVSPGETPSEPSAETSSTAHVASAVSWHGSGTHVACATRDRGRSVPCVVLAVLEHSRMHVSTDTDARKHEKSTRLTSRMKTGRPRSC